MSYFEEQEDAWMENDCKGSPEDYDPFDADSWPTKVTAAPKLTRSQKRNAQRRRAKKAANAKAAM